MRRWNVSHILGIYVTCLSRKQIRGNVCNFNKIKNVLSLTSNMAQSDQNTTTTTYGAACAHCPLRVIYQIGLVIFQPAENKLGHWLSRVICKISDLTSRLLGCLSRSQLNYRSSRLHTTEAFELLLRFLRFL